MSRPPRSKILLFISVEVNIKKGTLHISGMDKKKSAMAKKLAFAIDLPFKMDMIHG